MDISFWAKTTATRKAMTALPTTKERVRYLVDHANKPKYRACPCCDLNDLDQEYYAPRLGQIIIRSFKGESCFFKTVDEAVSKANQILEACVEWLKNEKQ
jgi:hypothetical protein